MLRYLRRLADKDIARDRSMIPLGSCTMKLNAAAEMLPITWAEFSRMHPFVPADQAQGYRQMFDQLEAWLAEITGFAAVSLQPNAGSQGVNVHVAVLVAAYHHHPHPRHHRAGRVRSMGGLGDEADVTLAFAAALVEAADGEQPRVLAL